MIWFELLRQGFVLGRLYEVFVGLLKNFWAYLKKPSNQVIGLVVDMCGGLGSFVFPRGALTLRGLETETIHGSLFYLLQRDENKLHI